jgi:hypothetical protein
MDLLRFLQKLKELLDHFGERVVFLFGETGHAAVTVVVKKILSVLVFQTVLALPVRHIDIEFIAQMLPDAADVVGSVFQEVAGLAAFDDSGLDHLQHPEG